MSNNNAGKNDNNVIIVAVATAIVAKDAVRADVTAGKIGFFDNTSGIAIDATNGSSSKILNFLAKTVNNGSVLLTPPAIQLDRVNSITKKAYSAGQGSKILITLPAIGSDSNAIIDVGDDIGITFSFETGNSWQYLGTNQLKKHFHVLANTTANGTATDLATSINADQESAANGGFITATASNNTVTVNFSNTQQDFSDNAVGIIVKVYTNNVLITTDDNFSGSQTPAFAMSQGRGAWVQKMEKENLGNAGLGQLGTYRYIENNYQFVNFVPDASTASNYTTYVINYDLLYPDSSGYNNNYEILIATADGTTVTALDALFASLTIPGGFILAA